MLPLTADSPPAEIDALRARVAELERQVAQQSAQRAAAEAALREREQELDALHETALVLMEHLDVTAALQAIVTRAAQLAGTQHGFVYLANQGARVLEARVGIGIHSTFVGFRIAYGEGIAGRVWQSGQPMVIHDYRSWPGRAQGMDVPNFHTIVAVPLIAHGDVIGVTGLSYLDPDTAPGPDIVELLTRFAQLASLALDNARHYTAARRQAQELDLLGQVRTALARELDLAAVFRTVVEAVARVFGYTQVSLYLLEGETLMLQHQVGYHQILQRIPITQGISGRVVRTGKPVLLEDVRADPAFIGAMEGIVSEVCVPLLDKERVIGTLNVESTGGVRLTQADLQLMVALAEQVVIAINRASLYGAVQRQVKELDALRATMTEISANLELDALLTAILERQVALLGATCGQVGLYDPDSGDLHVQVSYNMGQDYAGTRVALGEGMMGRAALTRQPLVISNYETWPERMETYTTLGPVTAIAVPMLAGDQLVGALTVGDSNLTRVFTEDDVQLLTLFAQQATVAIQNARLFAEVRQLATTDPLMEICNRRHFFTLAEHEFERARRYGRRLAAIMLDVDDFKRINDTLGHAVGDRVLQGVGERCRTTLRHVDVVGRYGGEEVAALLPDADWDSAHAVAERLRAALADLAPPGGVGIPPITVSIGLAVYEPPDSIDLETLIDRADRALYVAKHTGKNRVVRWGGGSAAAEELPPAATRSIKTR
ncbi:MAG TPA: GAF domain-containing protein [Roseiflexaceae bacterium]|nr:GAF domain-containing protein [Roseiflexaceae bacterium]